MIVWAVFHNKSLFSSLKINDCSRLFQRGDEVSIITLHDNYYVLNSKVVRFSFLPEMVDELCSCKGIFFGSPLLERFIFPSRSFSFHICIMCFFLGPFLVIYVTGQLAFGASLIINMWLEIL